MAECQNLCTAEKCQELENRIANLEQALNLLESSFEAHTQQDIPFAHNYNPDTEPVDLSDYLKKSDLDVQVDVFEQEDGNAVIKVQVIDANDEDTLIIKQDDLSVAVDVFEQSDGSAVIKVAVGNESDEDTLLFPQPTENDDVFDLGLSHNINFSVAGNFLTINSEISVNGETDSASDTVGLDFNIGLALFGSALQLSGNFMSLPFFESVQLGDLIQTVLINEQNEMECDFSGLENLINNLDNKINQIDGIITNIDNTVSDVNNALNDVGNDIDDINNKVDIIDDAVTVELTGTVENGSCELVIDDDGEALPVNPTVVLTSESYSGQGLTGINNAIQLIEQKLTAILSNTCQAIPPSFTVDLTDIAAACDYQLPQPEDYEETSTWFEATKSALAGFLSGSTLKVLTKTLNFVPGTPATFGVIAGANYIYKHLLDTVFKQENIAYADICQQLDQLENQDVVSLVASPKYVTNIDGDVLVLHFVTLDNYPKRSSNSSYRPIQIPAPLTSYDWDTDFKNLRWWQGNQYAEMSLDGYKAKVSGWFENEQRANEYFDAVLNLTTATQTNRIISKHTNPKTTIPIRETRPYRAFIVSTDNQGNATTLNKYYPLDNNDT